MDFRIADTFTDSLARMTGDEQKAVKTTAFDLQVNAATPGLSFHKLDKARDKHFSSVRVSADIRLIVHRMPNSLLLCYVDHHDKAYDWAERRRLETHPTTGAAQWVEIRETVKEVVVPVYVQTELPPNPKPCLFADRSDGELLGYGVPAEWLNDMRQATEDSLLLLADRLPAEAAEALLELATGGRPRVAQPTKPVTNPFEHPDSQLRFLAALGGERPNSLFFAGDLGQRIFQQPFSWKSLGVDIRGRSRTLRINYRTSHQIRRQADRLLGPEVTDVDGNREVRSDTVSVFNGPPPTIHVLSTEAQESEAVGAWLSELSKVGLLPHEVGIFVRSEGQLSRAQAAVTAAGLSFRILDEHVETASGSVSISTMHLAKGLEFRAVAVMACDDEVIPLQERIETVGDDADLKEVYDTERHLLYVACTRARDHLLITGVDPASEFLDDLQAVDR